MDIRHDACFTFDIGGMEGFDDRRRFLVSPSRNPASVARRNARERRRIKQVNQAFDELRQRVPCGDQYRKISKVETLRSAIEYIKALEEVVRKQKKKSEKLFHKEDSLRDKHFERVLQNETIWNQSSNFEVNFSTHQKSCELDAAYTSSMTSFIDDVGFSEIELDLNCSVSNNNIYETQTTSARNDDNLSYIDGFV